jgi:hypothetical protein
MWMKRRPERLLEELAHRNFAICPLHGGSVKESWGNQSAPRPDAKPKKLELALFWEILSSHSTICTNSCHRSHTTTKRKTEPRQIRPERPGDLLPHSQRRQHKENLQRPKAYNYPGVPPPPPPTGYSGERGTGATRPLKHDSQSTWWEGEEGGEPSLCV